MKAIMKTIKPKTCANIMNFIQSILVIRNRREATAIQKLIDENGYADIYVHCSKNGGNLLQMDFIEDNIHAKLEKDCDSEDLENSCDILNGQIVFKFRCYKIGIIHDFIDGLEETEPTNRHITISTQDELLKASCLTEKELRTYGGNYAIHISDLKIFDIPRKFYEFHTNIKKEPPEELLCPECGSKHLKVSELQAQVWNERVLRSGKLSKGKRKNYPCGDTFMILSCKDCGFALQDVQFQISKEGDILLDDYYFDEAKKRWKW